MRASPLVRASASSRSATSVATTRALPKKTIVESTPDRAQLLAKQEVDVGEREPVGAFRALVAGVRADDFLLGVFLRGREGARRDGAGLFHRRLAYGKGRAPRGGGACDRSASIDPIARKRGAR
jgi:hypothetical protein